MLRFNFTQNSQTFCNGNTQDTGPYVTEGTATPEEWLSQLPAHYFGALSGNAAGTRFELHTAGRVPEFEGPELFLPLRSAYAIDVTAELQTGNDAPVADAGPAIEGRRGQPLALSGGATDDGLPDPPSALTYQWRLREGPDGGQVTFADPARAVRTATFTRPGHYVLELRASDSDKSATATTAADIVDHFRVEMKAWIPHAEILDPYAPAEPVLFPKLLAPYLAEPLRDGVSSVFAPNASPLTVARITSRFAGDAHTGFGVVDAASPDYRIRTFAEFDFDGAKISDFRTDSGVGLTSRVIRASSGTRSASCAQTATANPAFWTRAVKTGDTTFTIGVSGYDPLVPAHSGRLAADLRATAGCVAAELPRDPPSRTTHAEHRRERQWEGRHRRDHHVRLRDGLLPELRAGRQTQRR